VQAAVGAIALAPGDIAILNDPYAGGTHLPDITMVLPVFLPGRDRPSFYVSNRAHHADVGGAFPGSMGPANEIFQEGIRIPPTRIWLGRCHDAQAKVYDFDRFVYVTDAIALLMELMEGCEEGP